MAPSSPTRTAFARGQSRWIDDPRGPDPRSDLHGHAEQVIAARLGLSENTVKVHVRNIFKKMNVRNRTEAASRYFTAEADSEHVNE